MRVIPLILIGGAVALGIATGVPPVDTQTLDLWRPAVGGDSVPRSIADAERQGGSHPRSEKPVRFQQRQLDRAAVGTAARRCVDVGDANTARSGEIIGTTFRVYEEYWRRGAPPKLSWAWGHAPPIGEPRQLILKAARLDAPAEGWVFVGDVDTYRWTAVALAKVTRTPWWRGTSIAFPSAGRWLIVASIGEDWGCFVYDLG